MTKWTCTPSGTWVEAPPPPQDLIWLAGKQADANNSRVEKAK